MPGLFPVDGGGGVSGVSLNIGGSAVSGGGEMSGFRKYGSDLSNVVQFNRPSTGEKYDPTGTPTVTFYVNNVVNSTVGALNMSKVNSKTGFYGNPNVAGGLTSTNGFNVGDFVEVHVEAVVDGVNVAGVIDKFEIYRAPAVNTSGYVTVAPDGLDQLSDAAPTSHPTTFATKLMALAAMFVNKTTRNKQTGVVSVLADDHSTVAAQYTTTPDNTAASTTEETKTQYD